MPTREQQTNVRRFTAGALAGASRLLPYDGTLLTCQLGITSVFFTYPLDVIRVRMAFNTSTSRRPGFLYAVRKIYHETAAPSSASSSASASTSTHIPTTSSATATSTHTATSSLFSRFPILKFYRGFSVTIMGMVPYAGTSFLTWGFLRSRFIPPNGSKAKPHPIADLTIGAMSGMISQTASYPFEVVRRRMQVGGLTHPDRWLSWRETVQSIWRARGWRGFYVGLGVGYLKIIPMTSVSFAVWQWMKRVLDV